jgi:predicted esterase/sugar lactone lactonase YvrE
LPFRTRPEEKIAMRRRYTSLPALLVLTFGAMLAAPAGAVTLKLTVDGVTRTALVQQGKDAATTPSPVIFAFHGAGGNSQEMASRGFAKAWPEATLVYPQGLPRRDPGSTDVLPAWQHSPGEFGDRDLRFIDALMRELKASYKVDTRRVYATGFSAGAIFTYFLLLAQPERFAAFAPVEAWVPPGVKWARLPRPVLIINGQRDYPYDSEKPRSQLLRLNACPSTGTGWAPGATIHQPCASGAPVILSFHNGGHVWPSTATASIVRFFQEHALTEAPPEEIAPLPTGEGQALAGTGRVGYEAEGTPAAAAPLDFPTAVAVDPAGGVLLTDTNNHRVRRIGPDGSIMSAAGDGYYGYLPGGNTTGSADKAQFFFAEAVVTDRAGNRYIADTGNRRVLLATPDGTIRIIAGTEASVGERSHLGFGGDGGPATQAELSFPYGLAVDAAGALYIADTENHRVRKVAADGTITTVAGTGMPGFSGDGGPAIAAELNAPWGLALDTAGNLYIADSGNHRVRRLAPDGSITTVAGSGTAGFSGDGGPATAAQLHLPVGLAVDSRGALLISDSLNRRIRRMSPEGTITTAAGEGAAEGGGAAFRFVTPAGIAIDREGNLLVADPFAQRVWRVPGIAVPGLIAGQPIP